MEALQIQDVFVLRRVCRNRFVHVGGIGRGEGWAGLTELRLDVHASARSAYDEKRIVQRTGREPVHVFGPYWAFWSAVVPVDNDVIVLLGGPWSDKPRDTTALQEVAASAAREIQVVSPAKRLADELEILHAVQNLMACEPDGLRPVMQHVIDCATESLSCEFGIVWLRRDGECAVSQRGWSPDTEPACVPELLERQVSLAAARSVCIQNASERPLPAPLHTSNGVRSYYLLPLGNLALMLLIHTQVDPRGFTQLCQELGRRLAESGEVLLRAALQRENLSRELERVSDEARRDPLTGLANRLAWEERLQQLATQSPEEAACAVICLDLVALRSVNNQYGHAAGDSHLRTMADIISENVRPQDFPARLGGDEFAVLLPDANTDIISNVLARLNAAAEAHPGTHGVPIRFVSGGAVWRPGCDIHAALREADANLIRNKQENR